MQENQTVIVANEPLGGKAFRLRFAVDWSSYVPGQFVMVAIPGGEVFLRRPFGIARLAGGAAEICCKVVGRGTEALARAAVGTPLAVVGPCGTGFRLPPRGTTAVLVAGGYGVGPMLGLAEALCASGTRAEIFYGASAAGDLLYREELAAVCAKVYLATEDGSAGAAGLVTELVEQKLASMEQAELFACGPEGMLRAVAAIGRERKIPTQVSLERYMACGIGVCMGCACTRADGSFARTCREGPVFDAGELQWE